MTKYHWDSELDSTGLLCPLPVLKIRKKLKEMQKGDILRVIADDPAAIVDIPHYCHESGDKILRQDISDEEQIYLLMKM
ncbi:MAG: preprotein translocase subunit TatB [Rhodobacteraceae bacterium]|nr:preprotein translocase subunit TatB [Paracoccaceae bacterium]MBT4284356.1 preprotein translocase subunit TatB [Paracoccaceae bacterium]MBT4778021.1 preprotein translocase subunit TatB [Paracoccaceae bacterium]MBT6271236.1 preprotein translocase subunit TatB [Paracoccaceae bacterium]MBT6436848.1 preprotein translocase subunit TatB [Paracoccaceae bacterium]